MSATSGRRESLPSMLWLATMREGFPLLAVGLVIFLTGAWTAWRTHAHTLGSLAAALRWPVFWLGVWILTASIYSTWALQRPFLEALIEPIRELFLGVRDRARVAAGATATPDIPGTMAVTQPILAGLSAACLGVALGLHVIASFSPDPSLGERGALAIPMYIVTALVLWSAMYHSTSSTRRLLAWSQEAAASAATAEADADRARISALQAQMNPHFLFNALNTVASLLGSDGERARRTVQNLSGMLTHTLQRSTTPLTTVEEELQFVREYLEIERERFGDRLSVTYDIDPETLAMAVPTMSLQPLVENAIKHAVTTRLEGGHIRISVRTRADS